MNSTEPTSDSTDELVLCPRCEKQFPPGEFLAGVCAGCTSEIQTHHHIERAEHAERPLTRFTSGEMDSHNLAWQDEGITPIGQFNFDHVFEADEGTRLFFAEASEDVRAEAAHALSLILAWCWTRGFTVAMRKFATLTAGLRPDLLNDFSYGEIGKALGVGKAAVSKSAVDFQRAFGITFARGRGEEARRHMAEARRGKPSNRRPPAHPPAPPPTPGKESFRL